MRVFVKCFAELSRYCPAMGRDFEAPEGETATGLRERLGVPAGEVALVFVNGARAGVDQVLADGDQISFFPEITGG